MIKKDIETSQKKLNDVEKDLLGPEDITDTLTEQEGMSRSKNLCVEGIVETNNNSQENCEKQFLKLIKEKLEIRKNIETDATKEVNHFLSNNEIEGQAIDFK